MDNTIPKEKYLVITFDTTTQAYKMEKLRRNDCLDGRLIPLPVVHVKKAIEESRKGDLIVVKVNDNVKLENIKRLCSNKGCDFSINEHSKDDIDIIITVDEKAISGNYKYV